MEFEHIVKRLFRLGRAVQLVLFDQLFALELRNQALMGGNYVCAEAVANGPGGFRGPAGATAHPQLCRENSNPGLK